MHEAQFKNSVKLDKSSSFFMPNTTETTLQLATEMNTVIDTVNILREDLLIDETLKRNLDILTNISPDLGHFFIKPVNAPLSLKYKSGALPAGMAVRIEVSAHHQSHLLDNAQHDGGCISSRLTSS